MFQVVLFDLDGTLVDSAPDIVRALNATLAEAGLPTHSLARAVRFIGDGAAKLIERSLPPGSPAAATQSLLRRFQDHYGAHLCDDTQVYPGMRSTLESLAAHAVSMAVITNKPLPLAQGILQQLDLARFFVRVVGDGAGFPRKPDPAAARDVLAALGRQADETVMVGDGLPDAGLARALPCKGVAAGWGYADPAELLAAGAEVVIDRPQDLLALLELS